MCESLSHDWNRIVAGIEYNHTRTSLTAMVLHEYYYVGIILVCYLATLLTSWNRFLPLFQPCYKCVYM